MKLRKVEFSHDLETTLKRMRKHGLLLTSADSRGKPNVMAIGWGTPGVIWSRPVFVVLVRPSRYTFGNLEATGEFVVNVPTDDMHDVCMHCGTVSGRDHDKFQECSLTLAEAKTVRAPLIEQCVMHYECRVLLRNDVVESQLDPDVRSGCYAKGDFHRIYYGEILRAAVRAG
jgi:flavin reductase (DIM6/NTAB) family NADH-FMN oxidoreductase RutF